MSDQTKHSEVKKKKRKGLQMKFRSPVGEFDSERELGNLEYLLCLGPNHCLYRFAFIRSLSLGSWVGGFCTFGNPYY